MFLRDAPTRRSRQGNQGPLWQRNTLEYSWHAVGAPEDQLAGN